jgi:prepilin-type N-terminal cleavage/methylation domain-containing protein
MTSATELAMRSRIPAPIFKHRAGFTLVEMLVVIAVIAILTALLAPAAQSLMGISGRRGGMNALSSALEQARLRAVEKQASVFVGFPLDATNPNTRFSSILVFENAPGFTPVGRWIRLPTGVYYEPSSNFPTAPTITNIPTNAIPDLEGERLQTLHALHFDRFGRMVSGPPVRIRVGEKPDPLGDFLRSSSNYFELTVYSLTGRVTMEDKSAKR